MIVRFLPEGRVIFWGILQNVGSGFLDDDGIWIVSGDGKADADDFIGIFPAAAGDQLNLILPHEQYGGRIIWQDIFEFLEDPGGGLLQAQ